MPGLSLSHLDEAVGRALREVRKVLLEARKKETLVTWWQKLGNTVACSNTGSRKRTHNHCDLTEEISRQNLKVPRALFLLLRKCGRGEMN